MSLEINNKLVLGTVQLGLSYGVNNSTGKPTDLQAQEILKKAYEFGVRYLDTAESYGNSQEIIGRFNEENIEKFNLIGKLNLDLKKFSTSKHIGLNLSNLKIDSYYGYMFHSFHNYKENKKILNELIHLKKDGLINKIGVSIYKNEEFEELLHDENIELIQIPYNLLDNHTQKGDLLNYAKQKGCEIHARSIFLQGLFFKNLNDYNSVHQPLKKYVKKLFEIAKKENLTIEELCFGYVIYNECISKVLFGVETIEQLSANLQTIKKINKNQGVIDQINDIYVNETVLLNPVFWL